MVESLFDIIRQRFFSVRIITDHDVKQLSDFKHLLLGHFNSMDLSLTTVRHLHLTNALVLARTAVQVNDLMRESQDLSYAPSFDYSLFILSRLELILESVDSMYELSQPKAHLDLSSFTIWSDFHPPSSDSSASLFTISSTPREVLRSLLRTHIVRPNLYYLLSAKVTALVSECQHHDDLIHAFVHTRFQCICTFGYVRLELIRMISNFKHRRSPSLSTSSNTLSPAERFSISRTECERGLRQIIHMIFQDRKRWMSPEDPISESYVDESLYYS